MTATLISRPLLPGVVSVSAAPIEEIRQAFQPVRVAEVVVCPLSDQAFAVVRGSDIGVARLLAASASARAGCLVRPVTDQPWAM